VAFASEAQKKKFQALVLEGKMTQATFDKHESETITKTLPKKAAYKPKGQVRGVRRVR
jgi:hypothetical protein